jgi:hypothetical protein
MTPRREKRSPKWCSTQAVDSRTCNVCILMCRSGVGLILVMFDVLDCYILYRCLLLFVYCIPVLEAPRPGRQTKQDFF